MVEELKRKAVRGTFVMGASRFVSGLAFLLCTVVLARLVSPANFGLIDMAATLTALLAVSTDLGLGLATVQRERLDQKQVSVLFWINTGFGTLLWAICTGAGPLLVWFYGERDLARIAPVMGLAFFWMGVSAQPMALLQRRMLFGRIGIVEVASQCAGLGISVLLAYLGYGYWALAFNQPVRGMARVILAMLLSGFRPYSPGIRAAVLPMLRFGGYLVGFNFILYLVRNCDKIVIGRFCGKDELGYYSRSYLFHMLPLAMINDVVTRVATPYLSRLQSDPRRLGENWLKISGLMFASASLLAAFMGMEARQIVMVLLGPKWSEAIPILAVLGWFGIVAPVANLWGQVYVALGRTDLMAKLAGLLAVPMIAAFLVGVHWGPVGVAFGLGATILCISLPVNMGLIFWLTGTDLIVTARHWNRPLLSLLLWVVIMLSLRTVLDRWVLKDVLHLVVMLLGGVTGFLVLSLIFLRKEIKEIVPYMSVQKRGNEQ